MKELFREADLTRVGFFQSVLESEGIPTFVRNQNLANSGITNIPIPDFYPALCVLDDGDYERAVKIIREQVLDNAQLASQEIRCPSCNELNPGTFEICWSCGKNLS